jgi:hypothetical protein
MVRKPRSDRKKLEDEADALWRQAVYERDGWRCRRCGKTHSLHAHHIRSRRFRNTRWDVANGLLVCQGCHFWIHHWLEPDATIPFYEGLGIDYEALRIRSLCSAKGLDLKIIIIALKQEVLHGNGRARPEEGRHAEARLDPLPPPRDPSEMWLAGEPDGNAEGDGGGVGGRGVR